MRFDENQLLSRLCFDLSQSLKLYIIRLSAIESDLEVVTSAAEEKTIQALNFYLISDVPA